jgi:major membrane immunogen (membrane-anchored lipoprotein)
MLLRISLKTFGLLTFILFVITVNATKNRINYSLPIANAGSDQTIYLTQTSTVTLDGSASFGDSYQWKDISTDYKSGAVITSPTSLITKVTGLIQGTWYYQLAVTTGNITVKDTLVIRVDYDVPPANSTLLRELPITNSDFINVVNIRDDTTKYWGYTNDPTNIHTNYGVYSNQDKRAFYVYLDRGHLPNMAIDSARGKLYATVQDGWPWAEPGVKDSYCRAELSYGSGSNGFTLDSNKTYVFEWKGYYPQLFDFMKGGEALTIFQLHPLGPTGTLFQFDINANGSLIMHDNINGSWINNVDVKIANLADFYIKTHTIRTTIREGKSYANQTAFIKVELDGIQKYYRDTGIVGTCLQSDYIKFGGIYDYSNSVVSADSFYRRRQASIVTEGFRAYQLNINSSITVNAGVNQTVLLPLNHVSLLGIANETNEQIASYLWTKISGPANLNIGHPESLVTDVTGLTEGVYQLELKVTDNKGATAKDTITITVNPAKNIPPTANAGPNQTITLPVSSTILTGSATDSDGHISDYLWEKISGPSNYQIVNSNLAIANITSLTEGTYQFQLTVTDDKGATASSTVQIVVNPPLNIPPAANAGTNQTITLPINTATINGSGRDSDGTISSYSWIKILGPSSGTINNQNSASATIINLLEGVYQFELQVTDDKGAVGRDTVQITINAASNILPTANAGTNQTMTLPIDTISLSGSGSDVDGTISSYLWTKISGPSSGTINNANSTSAVVNNLSEGVYLFELKVTDDKGGIAKDTVRITVIAAPNIPPTADAGQNQTITLPLNTVTLNGSAKDSDGTIATYLWTKISGPNAGIISNPSSANMAIKGLLEGIYFFQLTVTDNEGATGTDTVQITVNAPPNIPPTANAGQNQTITLPLNTVALNGSGTDSDGTIAFYLWTKISGPNTGTISNPLSASTSVKGLLEGIYVFQLTVTDNKGATGTDTVQITVNAAPNIPPTVNAGTNQTITLPLNTVTLNGSGRDSDGTIATYLWTKISGLNSAIISNPSSASTTIKGLLEGIYVFKLTVTDNQGATGTDTVQITVNAAPNIPPTVNAGTNQTITLPVNTVTFNGSGKDSDGTVATYLWTKISGPSVYNIFNSSSAVTTVSGLVQGGYQFELKVTDDKGAIGKDTVQITVNPAPNIPPIANAGSNQTITLPTNTVTLNGGAADSDGTISSYLWTKIAGPSTGIISDSSSAVTTVKGLISGNYIFELTVTDDQGAKGTDSIYVTVNAAKNMGPTANAGGDLTIVLPVNTLYLNGSGNDTGGTITGYKWKQIGGPDSALIATNNKASTVVKNLVAGTYEFELTVTDNNHETGRDTVRVVVALARISAEPNSIKIYPNPIVDKATVEITSENINAQLTLIISDFAGKILYKKQVNASDYKATEKINMSTFSKGSYAVTVFFDEKDKQVLTIIKQ